VTIVSQRSFAGGELAPALYGRVDMAKYTTGLRTMRNTLLMRHGGSASRPGTSFVCEIKDSTQSSRIVPFVFNSDQTYMLEFGDQYMRVNHDGAQVVESPLTITGATQANPCVATIVGHGLATGQEVFINGVVGMTALNQRNFKVTVLTANTVSLQYMNGLNVNSAAFGAYTSGGTASRVYTITTPYIIDDIPTLQFIQSADVITITHKNYAQRELSRTGHTSWTLSTMTFTPTITHPTGANVSSAAAGTSTYKYKITAVKAETFEESLSGTEAAKTITGATQANPVVITTSAAHNYATADEVEIDSVVGMTELNGRRFTITVLSGTTYSLTGVDGTAYTAYSSGGTSSRTHLQTGMIADPTVGSPTDIAWTAVSGAVEYNVYREKNGIFGFIAVCGTASFRDTGYIPDSSDTPPAARNPFDGPGNYPQTVAYIQQRLMFANSTNKTETVWGSRTGQYNNFTVSSPLQDDDAVTFTMAGRQVNEVKHLLDLGQLIVFTSGGEWTCEGSNSGAISPTDINLKQHSYNGSSDLAPLVVGGNALYVQARGSIVRDLAFEFEADGYRGNDLTVFSSHLVDGYTLTDWAYQQIPHSIVWAVRSDGVLLGMTYVREQQMVGWHRHDFGDGLVESVAVIPEGAEDAVYVIVKRVINGFDVRYIERMNSRRVTPATIKDFIGMDSALSYDGRNLDAGNYMTLANGLTWAQDETINLNASNPYFVATDVGNEIHITGDDGTIIRFRILSYVNSTQVTGRPQRDIPVSMQNTPTIHWAKAVDQISGLWHLEGEEVSVFGDGFVVASPKNSAYVVLTVASGSVTLDKCYSVIHIGLPYICDLETLDLDTTQGETLAGKQKKVDEVTLHLENSRGIWVGPKPPTDDDTDPLEFLDEMKIRNLEGYDDPVDLLTGTKKIIIRPEWNTNGRVFIRQVDPIPVSVLAVSPSGMIPLRGA
jgi:hypothetical protein